MKIEFYANENAVGIIAFIALAVIIFLLRR